MFNPKSLDFTLISCCRQADCFPPLSRMQRATSRESGKQDAGGGAQDGWRANKRPYKCDWRSYDRLWVNVRFYHK